MSDPIRELEVLKARYCRLLDTKRWDDFRSLFTDDFVSDTTESGGVVIEGADAFVSFVSSTLGQRMTVHQVQQSEFAFPTPGTAEGIWAMRDVVRPAPGVSMFGYGHYHETYQKDGDAWLFASSRLTRLRMHIETPFATAVLPLRLLPRMSRLTTRLAKEA